MTWGRIKVKTVKRLIRKYDIQFIALQKREKDFIDLEFGKRLWGDYDMSWKVIPTNNTARVFSMSRMHKGNGFLANEDNWRDNNEVITLVNVYSPCDLEGKRRLWRELLDYKNSSNVFRRCIMEDFNSLNKEIEEFNAFIENLETLDVHMINHKFTWYCLNGELKAELI
ncbi:hypothetical protein GmHk_04G011213 [Glycine max]|nr:hypothetical protein GmHk_04G011213 [Glycine max]